MTTITRTRLSAPLVATAAAVFAVGVGMGGLKYLRRSAVHAQHSPGAAAWPAHLALAVVAVALLIAARSRRRAARSGEPLLLAPLGTRADHRLRHTARTAPARLMLIAPFAAVLIYDAWRVGEQVLAGLDRNFTVNAWGGPSYLGALFAHYLDAGLTTAAAAVIIDRLMLRIDAGVTSTGCGPSTDHRLTPTPR